MSNRNKGEYVHILHPMKNLFKIINSLPKLWFLLFIGAYILIIGITLNQTAINANDGLMPVSYEGYIEVGKPNYSIHEYIIVKDKSEVKFYYLGDIFVVNNSVSSIGDFILWFGLFFNFMIAFTMILYNVHKLLASFKLKKMDKRGCS